MQPPLWQKVHLQELRLSVANIGCGPNMSVFLLSRDSLRFYQLNFMDLKCLQYHLSPGRHQKGNIIGYNSTAFCPAPRPLRYEKKSYYVPLFGTKQLS